MREVDLYTVVPSQRQGKADQICWYRFKKKVKQLVKSIWSGELKGKARPAPRRRKWSPEILSSKCIRNRWLGRTWVTNNPESLHSYGITSHQQQYQMSTIRIFSGKENFKFGGNTLQESIQTYGIVSGASIVINIQNLILPVTSASKQALQIAAPKVLCIFYSVNTSVAWYD